MSDPLLRYVARVTLEAATPFLVSRGPGGLWDAVWVEDANGLPVLPGSSLTGVLRTRLEGHLGEGEVNDLFGKGGEDGRGSRLTVSWGCLHDAGGTPVEGLRDPERLAQDPVLLQARTGLVRDHVRINGLGAADARGKFDEKVVGAGHRFTFELELAGTTKDEGAWITLLKILKGGLTIGGKGRRGLGRFHLVNLHARGFDLQSEADRTAFLALPRRLAEPAPGLTVPQVPALPQAGFDIIRLQLVPVGLWLFGKGEPIAGADVDIAPRQEPRIVWNEAGQGAPGKPGPLIPGSAIKGALRHRTLFHLHAATLAEAEDPQAERERLLDQPAEPALVALFGSIRDSGDGPKGQAGRIMIDDVYLASTPSVATLPHVSVDRFTGGVRAGFLFSEQAFARGEIALEIRIDRTQRSPEMDRGIAAFRKALEDLVDGRLAIGGGTGRGHGAVTGHFEWAGGEAA